MHHLFLRDCVVSSDILELLINGDLKNILDMNKCILGINSIAQQNMLGSFREQTKKSVQLNIKSSTYVKLIREKFEEREAYENIRNAPEITKLQNKVEEGYKETKYGYKNLYRIVQEDKAADIYIVNTDHKITETIVNTFEDNDCEVTVAQVEVDLLALFVLLGRKINMKKLRKVMDRGRKFGLEFFVTKTGMTTSLMAKIQELSYKF